MTPRVALVTGGSRGIGRACVRALALTGHRVVVNYREDAQAAHAAVAEVVAAGTEGVAIAADVGEAAAAERLFRDAVAVFGRVDVLVCNAGVAPTTPLDMISLQDWQRVLDVNTRSVFVLGRLALQDMRPRGWGRIVTIASQARMTGGFFVGAHYAASKGAMIALSRSLAKLAARDGVTVNCLALGLLDTDMTRAFDAEARERLVSAIPMGRMGTAEEVGAVVAFLASEAASYITGAVLPVDGGLLSG